MAIAVLVVLVLVRYSLPIYFLVYIGFFLVALTVLLLYSHKGASTITRKV